MAELRVAIMSMHNPQWVNIPLQSLDRNVLTVGAVSGPRC